MFGIPTPVITGAALALAGVVVELVLPWHAFGPLLCLAGATLGVQLRSTGWLVVLALVVSAGLIGGGFAGDSLEAVMRGLVLAGGVWMATMALVLRNNNNSFRSPRAETFDLIPVACLVTTAAGDVVDANRAFCALVGMSLDTVLEGQKGSFIRHWMDEGDRTSYWQALTVQRRVSVEVAAVDAGGRPRRLRLTGEHGLRDGADLITHLVEDLTDLRGAEQARLASDKMFQGVFEGASVGMMVTSGARVVRANQRLEQLLGCQRHDLDGTAVSALVHPDDLAAYSEAIDRLLLGSTGLSSVQTAGFKPRVTELRYLRRDGEQIWLRSSASLVQGEALGDIAPVAVEPGTVPDRPEVFILAVYEDVTERKRINAALLRTEAKYANLFNLSPLLISLTDLSSGEVLEVNDTFCSTSGYSKEDVVGKTSIAAGLWQEAAERGRFSEVMREQGEVSGWPVTMIARGGDTLMLSVSARRLRLGNREVVLALSADVTDQRRLEAAGAQWRHRAERAERLEALGVLAGGVAHDFNNLLAGIGGNADLLVLQHQSNPTVLRRAEAIRDSVQRGAELTARMLAHGGRLPQDNQAVDLCELVDSFVAAELDDLSGRVAVELDCQDGGVRVRGDRGQLERVLRELVSNAVEAMAGADGQLHILACTRHVDEQKMSLVAGSRSLQPGVFAVLEVTDTGPGIPPSEQGRVLEPFYSSAEPGRGLGLGAVVGIARAHRGGVVLASSAAGTRVTVLLGDLVPDAAVAPGATAAAPTVAKPAVAKPAVAKSEGAAVKTVLLVDDDDSILQLLVAMFQRFGWHSLQAVDADSGETAMESLQPATGVQLAMVDLTLPGRPGRELLEALRLRYPDLPLVAMSGRSAADIQEEFSGWHALTVLPKPFAMADLQRLIDALPEPAACAITTAPD